MPKIKFNLPKDQEKKCPARSGAESAGMDVYAYFNEPYVTLPPNTTTMIPTGIKSVIEPGYFCLLEERGSTGSKGIKRSAGVIDSDYRGEWFVALTNANAVPVYIVKKEYDEVCPHDGIHYPYEKAIAQAILLPVPEVETELISEDEFANYTTARGTGKLGSSGK